MSSVFMLYLYDGDDERQRPTSMRMFSTRELAEAYGEMKDRAEAEPPWDHWDVAEFQVDDSVWGMSLPLWQFGGHTPDWKPKCRCDEVAS